MVAVGLENRHSKVLQLHFFLHHREDIVRVELAFGIAYVPEGNAIFLPGESGCVLLDIRNSFIVETPDMVGVLALRIGHEKDIESLRRRALLRYQVEIIDRVAVQFAEKAGNPVTDRNLIIRRDRIMDIVGGLVPDEGIMPLGIRLNCRKPVADGHSRNRVPRDVANCTEHFHSTRF